MGGCKRPKSFDEGEMIMISMETQGNCTIFKVTGEVTATDIVVQATQYISGKQTDTSLWDFSQAASVDISTAELDGLATSIKNASTDGKVRKVALVGSKSINIGLGKFFAAIAVIYDLPNEYQVFRTVALAMDWLEKTEKGE